VSSSIVGDAIAIRVPIWAKSDPGDPPALKTKTAIMTVSYKIIPLGKSGRYARK
jgi:hypothetical protein